MESWYFKSHGESRAFGMILALYEESRFDSWDDFRDRLIQEISSWEKLDDKDKEAWNYYDHWLARSIRVTRRGDRNFRQAGNR